MSCPLNCSFRRGAALECRNRPERKGDRCASVGGIFFRLAMPMPAAIRGPLPKTEYAALMAYRLQ